MYLLTVDGKSYKFVSFFKFIVKFFLSFSKFF